MNRFDLQLFAVDTKTVKSADLAKVRDVDFTEQFQNGYTGFERFQEIMNIEPEIQDANDAVALTDVKGTIDFENVSFQYKDNQEKVLNRINLHVPAGAYMALVGSSGAGKTTLCSLIPRFYDVTGGTIRVDGQDIRKIKLSDLRNHIGIVQQDVYLLPLLEVYLSLSRALLL